MLIPPFLIHFHVEKPPLSMRRRPVSFMLFIKLNMEFPYPYSMEKISMLQGVFSIAFFRVYPCELPLSTS